MNNDTTNIEKIEDHVNVIKNLIIGIMEKGVAIDVAIERAVEYHVAMMRGG